MNRISKKLQSFSILSALILTSPFQVMAADAPTTVANGTVDECSKDLLLAYFPQVFVVETLKKFNVPADKQQVIAKALSEKDKAVVKLVEDKAAQMSPNPLKDPEQRQQAVKIFRETLFEVFAGVLKDNGVSDDKQIQAMLDDVQQQKAKRFSMCMQKQKVQQPESQPAPAK